MLVDSTSLLIEIDGYQIYNTYVKHGQEYHIDGRIYVDSTDSKATVKLKRNNNISQILCLKFGYYLPTGVLYNSITGEIFRCSDLSILDYSMSIERLYSSEHLFEFLYYIEDIGLIFKSKTGIWLYNGKNAKAIQMAKSSKLKYSILSCMPHLFLVENYGIYYLINSKENCTVRLHDGEILDSSIVVSYPWQLNQYFESISNVYDKCNEYAIGEYKVRKDSKARKTLVIDCTSCKAYEVLYAQSKVRVFLDREYSNPTYAFYYNSLEEIQELPKEVLDDIFT